MMISSMKKSSLVAPPSTWILRSLTSKYISKNTSANQSPYNRRFIPSQGQNPNYYTFVSKLLPPGAAEKFKTDRNPNNWNSGSIFQSNAVEFRFLCGDYIYQIMKRLHRSNDAWTRSLFAYTCFSFMMFSQAFLWKFHFFTFSAIMYSRIRDRGMEPEIDQVHILDTIFENQTTKKFFSPTTYHVIDYHQQFDKGIDAEKFPDYDTPISRFFNVDTNTTTGFYKFGDVESGATMTLSFKTMPFANNRYNLSEPFLIYDLKAEISHEGQFITEHIIKEEEVLKSKKIFVIWH